jgi:recombination DNA repair RAD52 pathway protein
MSLSQKQLEVLAKPLNSSRVAKRSQGGKQLSYLEAWEVKAHLIRVFGYGNFDAELLEYGFVDRRDYESTGDSPKPMVEVIWHAKVRLSVRDPEGTWQAEYTEAAVGSASGPVSMLGEHHDNAVKQAESDALKRCAVYLGNQFGLSLYDNGTTVDVVKGTLLDPPKQKTEEEKAAEARVAESLGATPVNAEHNTGDQASSGAEIPS